MLHSLEFNFAAAWGEDDSHSRSHPGSSPDVVVKRSLRFRCGGMRR